MKKLVPLVPLVAAAILMSLWLVQLSWGGSLGLAGYLPTPQPGEVCDLCEPNSVWEQACGPLEPGLGYEYLIRCTEEGTDSPDDDFYYVDVGAPGVITLDLTGIPPNTDYSIYLYDDRRTLTCYSDNHGSADEHVECPVTRVGRYRVRVWPWTGCSDSDPYTLTVTYPPPPPTPRLTATPTPPCNIQVDNFGDTDPKNDLREPSAWGLDPPGCGTFDVTYTGGELRLTYDLTAPGECTAFYSTTLSLNASAYRSLAFEIKGGDQGELSSTAFGLRDQAGHEMRVKGGDLLHQVLTDTWQGGNLPLVALGTAVDASQLDAFLIEIAEAQGASQGTIYLDRIRFERSQFPLTVDNFDDLADPNALGGSTGVYMDEIPGTSLETDYTREETYADTPGSFVISYTVPAGAWALWETYLPELDLSDYAFLHFYVKGALGGEKINLYLEDGGEMMTYVDVEDYAPISTEWAPVRIPLHAFSGLSLTDLAKLKFVFEWEPMTGTVFLDNLRFVADTLLIDSFCDSDENNSINGRAGDFTSAPACEATITRQLSNRTLSLDYDVSAGSECFCGYWSKTLLDLNPYRSLKVKMRSEGCEQAGAVAVDTTSIQPDKIRVSDYLLDGLTDYWQVARIPLAASTTITDWARSDSYVTSFEAHRGATQGVNWWDEVSFETACVPLWVDNFNDEGEGGLNALGGSSGTFGGAGSEITASTFLTQAYGDVGAGLGLTYDVPGGEYAAWWTELRSADLTGYDRLVFEIKSARGGEKPNLYLIDADARQGFVNLETYHELSTRWQTIVIPLEDLGGVDLNRVQSLQVAIEWEPGDVASTLFLDNLRFLPAPDCSQAPPNQVLLPLIGRSYSPLDLNPVWDFESDTEGWTQSTIYTPTLAIVDVTTSTFRSLTGKAALAMTVNLVGGDSSLGKGAAYVDLADYPPPGTSAPLNLACKPIACWLYVPACGRGDPVDPNYVRLRVKDENGKYGEGEETTVVRDQWFEVKLRPRPGGELDPSRIIQLGVEFGARSEDSTYRGKVYLDACGWLEIDPAGATATGACGPGEEPDRGLPPVPPSEN